MDNSIILGVIIETRFIGPTDTKGSRISAVCKRDSERTYRKTVEYDHRRNSDDNHLAAAEAVMAIMETDLAYEGCEPFRIVGRGHGGRSDAGYYFLINRGGA